MIRAVVGAGGKTSLIKEYVGQFLAEGKKVFVTTSTHMFAENDTILSDDADEIIEKLKKEGYAMAGLPDSKEPAKIGPLSKDTYEKVCAHADEVLIEADGAKHLPLKYPRDNEPVIYDNIDEIIVVYGLHALGKKAGEVIHCFPLAEERLGIRYEQTVDSELIERLVREAYVEPLRLKYSHTEVKLRANDSANLTKDGLQDAADSYSVKKRVGCVIMASGLSRRFGRNKLLAEIDGESFIERILNNTGNDVFAKRVVVTRSKEVEELCLERNVNVIFHELEGRNDTVRLGLRALLSCGEDLTSVQKSLKDSDKDSDKNKKSLHDSIDACVFCPCDQPMLGRESLKKMVRIFCEGGEGIYRLSNKGKAGTPILFSKEFFGDLLKLPDKKGGSWVAKQNPEKVVLVECIDPLELYDVDTQEDYENLTKMINTK